MARLEARGATSCQYAMFLFRWLGRSPEDFVSESVVDHERTHLPDAGPGHRLRWNLSSLHSALNAERCLQGLTWSALADHLGCTSGRLTNLRRAKLADLEFVMTITQWLGRPAADFVHASDW